MQPTLRFNDSRRSVDPSVFETALSRILLVIVVAIVAHLLTLLLRNLSARLLASRIRSEAKAITVTGFLTSIFVFGIYFAAVGFALSAAGVPLATYLASASVIGLAVSFGSQGIVQDVITGLTVVFTDLIDVGDLIEVGGQVGIVAKVGMRFTVLVNFHGAEVFIPNRSIANVTRYPHGYVRVFLDFRLPEDPEAATRAQTAVWQIARDAYEQHRGLLLSAPTQVEAFRTRSGQQIGRIKFRIWPDQSHLIEGPIRKQAASAMRQIDASYEDWMIVVHARAEPPGDDPRRRLPRPAVLSRSARGQAAAASEAS